MQHSNVGWIAVLATGLAVGSQFACAKPMETGAAPLIAARVETTNAAYELSRSVLRSADHGKRPFAIVDKQAATIAVYLGNGALAGQSPVLIGQAWGDEAAAGAGDRAQFAGGLQAGDRTTPAGRFESEPGHNRAGEAIVWFDYDAALAIHRLRPGPTYPDRARRLTSTEAADKRVSAGCIVVPEAFYDLVVQPTLGRSRGLVYVLAEDPR